MTTLRNAAALAAGLALLACVPRPAPPAPAPAPTPPPIQAPPPSEPPPAPPSDWQDRPLSAGDWSYGAATGPRAAFASDRVQFVVECTAERRVRLARPDTVEASPPLTIRTTYSERRLAAATLAPSDPLLDEIAFSRGRFLVRAEGMPDLILPAWPEIGRVVEECRA